MKRALSFVYNELPEIYGGMVFIALVVYWQFSPTYIVVVSIGFVVISLLCAILGNIAINQSWQRKLLSCLPLAFITSAVLIANGHTNGPIQQLDSITLNTEFTGQGYTQESVNTYTQSDSAAPNSQTRVYHVDGVVYRVEVDFDESKLLAHQKRDIRDALAAQYGHRHDFTAESQYAVRSDGVSHVIFNDNRLIAYNIALNAKWYAEHVKQIPAETSPRTKVERIISG